MQEIKKVLCDVGLKNGIPVAHKELRRACGTTKEPPGRRKAARRGTQSAGKETCRATLARRIDDPSATKHKRGPVKQETPPRTARDTSGLRPMRARQSTMSARRCVWLQTSRLAPRKHGRLADLASSKGPFARISGRRHRVQPPSLLCARGANEQANATRGMGTPLFTFPAPPVRSAERTRLHTLRPRQPSARRAGYAIGDGARVQSEEETRRKNWLGLTGHWRARRRQRWAKRVRETTDEAATTTRAS